MDREQDNKDYSTTPEAVIDDGSAQEQQQQEEEEDVDTVINIEKNKDNEKHKENKNVPSLDREQILMTKVSASLRFFKLS